MKKLSALLLVLFCAFALVACAPKNSAKAKDKMEKAGYKCTATVPEEKAENGAIAVVTGTKGDGDSFIGQIASSIDNYFSATLFDSAKNAKASVEKADGSLPENTYVIGKWVFYGNEDAYKAFKK